MALEIVRTPRLLLRPWVREDVDALHAVWTAPEIRRYLWDDTVITRDSAEQVVESSLRTTSQSGIGYGVLHTLSLPSSVESPVVGFCGFRFFDEGPEIELMYGLRGAYWGIGLVTEACLASLEYLWRSTSFPRVYARTDPPNTRSLEVMRRLGMARESATDSLITFSLERPSSSR